MMLKNVSKVVRNEEVLVTTYTCPVCGAQSENARTIRLCMIKHGLTKYSIGAVVEYAKHWNSDREYHVNSSMGLITDVRADDNGAEEYCIEGLCYDVLWVDSLYITRIVKTAPDVAERKLQLERLVSESVSIPNVTWSIAWNSDICDYVIFGRAKD